MKILTVVTRDFEGKIGGEGQILFLRGPEVDVLQEKLLRTR